MLKKILKYSLVEATYKGINKLILLLLPLFLTGAHFGIVSYYISIEVLLGVILIAGFDKLTLKYSQPSGHNKPLTFSLRSQLISYGALILILIVLLFSGIRELISVSIVDLLLIGTAVLFSNLIIIQSAFYRSSDNVAGYFKVRVLYICSKAFFVIFCIYIWPNAQTYIYANLVSGLVALGIFFKFYTYALAKTTYTKAHAAFFLRFSLPFVFHTISTQLMGVFDRFLLFHYTDPKALGEYSLSYALGSSISFCFIGVSSYMEPLIYKEKSDNRQYYLAMYLRYALGIGFIGALIFFLLMKFNVIGHFYKGYSEQTWSNALKILIAHTFLPFYFMGNYNLTSKGRTISLASITITSSVFSCILSYFFIVFWGVDGAVWAVLVTYFVLALLILSNKHNRTSRMLLTYATFSFIILAIFLLI
jgi:O-antigen/teichoic acid export membrane protein